MAEKFDNTLVKRVAWFVGIWAASVLALAVVAYGIRLVLKS